MFMKASRRTNCHVYGSTRYYAYMYSSVKKCLKVAVHSRVCCHSRKSHKPSPEKCVKLPYIVTNSPTRHYILFPLHLSEIYRVRTLVHLLRLHSRFSLRRLGLISPHPRDNLPPFLRRVAIVEAKEVEANDAKNNRKAGDDDSGCEDIAGDIVATPDEAVEDVVDGL